MATALWRLGTKECFRSVGNNFGLGKATAKIVSNDVVHALVNRYDDFIKFPETEQEIRAAINKFQQLGNFPQVVGAIHGTYIQIIAPKEDKDDFYFIAQQVLLFEPVSISNSGGMKAFVNKTMCNTFLNQE